MGVIGADSLWAQDEPSRAARSEVFFKRKFKMADKDSHSIDSSVSGEEGNSDFQRTQSVKKSS